ncbi:STAS domain-containing protein [Mesobacillus subterraneus]|uniref:STAS domain-containing protein n=1 Tax=Mesobacillus subterraneus TaxID=285983 RepID=A0A3R9KYG8_9BACI|nr:STAS domain-containing protein [Mesobacillus subterraneus]RSD28956.1 STAS domain-containing protein [Mesobacillus subterraneus]
MTNKVEFEFIGMEIFGNRHVLAKLFTDNDQRNTTEQLEKFNIPESEYKKYTTEIIGLFGEALYKNQEEVYESVRQWAKNAANLTIKHGVTLTQSLRVISLFRLIIWELFTEELEQNRIECNTLVQITERYDKLIDSVFRIIGEVHENNNLMRVKSFSAELEILSVPVVPITQGVAVLPLIGTIDLERSKMIMQVSLNESIRLKLQHFILDFSKVTVIDNVVANSLFQIIKTLKLIGVDTIITGIRPAIAETITRIGFDFNITKFYSSLERALSDLGFKQVAAI